MKTTITIVRHGYSEANDLDIFAGNFDAKLTKTGEEQAEATALFLKDFPIDVIYSSDLSRAYSTALHISKVKNIPVIKNSKLREIDAGDWDGLTFSEIDKIDRENFRIWIEDFKNAVCTGGESVRDCGKRIISAVDEIIKENEGKSILIVSHATSIRLLTAHWYNIDLEDIDKIYYVSNASVSRAEYENNSYKVTMFDYNDHMGSIVTKLPEGL